jgi:catechol 2,3-dioxygenase-like lactoylglutathione lyase family enzyme
MVAKAKLVRAAPALPVSAVHKAADWYCKQLGFSVGYMDRNTAVLLIDDVILHLWWADDDTWTARKDLSLRPVCSGAESFLAGTASCRIEVDAIETLFAHVHSRGILHFSSHEVTTTSFGAREFHVSDPDGNLLTFVQFGNDERDEV